MISYLQSRRLQTACNITITFAILSRMLPFPSDLSLAALFATYYTSTVVICIVFLIVMIYSLMFSLKVSNPFKMLRSSSQLWLRYLTSRRNYWELFSSPSYYFQDSSEVGVRCHILSCEPVLRAVLTGDRKQYDRRCHEKNPPLTLLNELLSVCKTNNPNPFTERLGIYVLTCSLESVSSLGLLSSVSPGFHCSS